MGRWQREALTEGLMAQRCRPSTIACGDGPPPHGFAAGRIEPPSPCSPAAHRPYPAA
ncbi:protein of unknown function [uncultured Sphingopyxis sp.]|uniref:Uncharacterized protein n=1 Tax=uncultured Sphingopyxis sp. TaxID=310581 RepID=A0A1Y5PZ18_9SPHN|nr:protein of unknown function [uncultured Sphingopyxis sp.]